MWPIARPGRSWHRAWPAARPLKAADHAVVADQLLENAAGEHTLGAVGDVELIAIQATRFSDHPGDVLSGTYGRSGFKQYEIVGADHRRNCAGCGEHIVDIGLRNTVGPAAEGGTAIKNTSAGDGVTWAERAPDATD